MDSRSKRTHLCSNVGLPNRSQFGRRRRPLRVALIPHSHPCGVDPQAKVTAWSLERGSLHVERT